jgi:branched-chain amino acid transport system ATP-binding protein
MSGPEGNGLGVRGAESVLTPLLHLKGVSKRFGRLSVLENLDLQLSPGETLGILGPNGAGKTTLFGVIGGEHLPEAGTVSFDGVRLGRESPEARCRRGIARTFQIPRTFTGMSVLENLLVGGAHGAGLSLKAALERAGQILNDTGLYERRDLPASRLGLLDRKRLELARALMTDPRLLLLDEIAGGLTQPEVEQLLTLIRRIQEQGRERGLGIVWIEHIVHALEQVAGRIYVLSGGNCLVQGTPAEVLASRELQQVYLGVE